FPQVRDSRQNNPLPGRRDSSEGIPHGHDPYAAAQDEQSEQQYDPNYPADPGYPPAGPVDDQYGQGYYDPAMSGTENYPPPPEDPYDSSSLANPQVPSDFSPESMPTPLGIRGSRASRMLYMGHLPYEAGTTPIPGASQDEFITPPPVPSNTMIDVQRFGGGEHDQRPSRVVRISGVSEISPPPPLSENSPTPGITSQPEQNSDPKYQQLGLQGFERKDAGFAITTPPTISVGAGVGTDPSNQPTFKAPSIADIGRIPPPGSAAGMPVGFGATSPAGAQPPTASPYGGQGFGEIRGPAVDKDGRPLYVPALPEEKEDEGAYGRRVAAVAWLLFGILSAGAISLWLKQVSIAGSVTTPLILVGLMMFTGKKWSGVLGLLATVAYTALLAWIGHVLLNGDQEFLTKLNLDNAPPPLFGQMFYGLALTFLLSNLMMLISKPGVLRAILGAFLMVLPLVGVTGMMTITKVRPVVTNPLGGPNKAIIHLDDEGISFVKPDGWTTYNWADVIKTAPVAEDLSRQPLAFYLNDSQDMMFAIYVDDSAKNGLAQLFGGEKVTPLEEEVTRGLPSVGKDGETFDLQGKTFLENLYEGTTESNGKFSVIINKTQLGGRMLLVTMMRDARVNRATDDASKALDLFYESFEISDKKANDSADGEITAP
ncbi:MAG: hypothetical protein ABI579_03440, partial [Candidatus Sumerlaeota bacterium]